MVKIIIDQLVHVLVVYIVLNTILRLQVYNFTLH